MAVFIVSVNAQPKNEWKIISPDHSLQLIVSLMQGNLSFRVLGGKQTIIKPSSLGIERADQKFVPGSTDRGRFRFPSGGDRRSLSAYLVARDGIARPYPKAGRHRKWKGAPIH